MCHKCDTLLPTIYAFAGPHIKEICGACGAYIRFAPKQVIPDFKESKALIWAVTNDLAIIEKEKKEMGVFHKDLNGLARNMYYHNLYVRIIKNFF